jgi:glycosyltransferase involved in cell wall biosynthesis
MRYAWDLREQYLVESGLDSGVRGTVARAMLERLKRWDRARSADVDTFVTLSHYIEDRIQRAYGRSSAVIYPPVDVEFFTPGAGDPTMGDYYVTVSRFVPYKRLDLISRAFASLPDRPLVIVGDGPDAKKSERPPERMSRWSARQVASAFALLAEPGFLFAADEISASRRSKRRRVEFLLLRTGAVARSRRSATRTTACRRGCFSQNRRRRPSFVPFASSRTCRSQSRRRIAA